MVSYPIFYIFLLKWTFKYDRGHSRLIIRRLQSRYQNLVIILILYSICFASYSAKGTLILGLFAHLMQGMGRFLLWGIWKRLCWHRTAVSKYGIAWQSIWILSWWALLMYSIIFFFKFQYMARKVKFLISLFLFDALTRTT